MLHFKGPALLATALVGLLPQLGIAQDARSSAGACDDALARDSVLRGLVRACEVTLKRDPYAFNTRYYYSVALHKSGLSDDAARIIEDAVPLFRDSLGRLGLAVQLLVSEKGADYALRVLMRAHPPERDSTEARALLVYGLADSLHEQARPTIDSVLEQTPHSRTGLLALLHVLWYGDRTSKRAREVLGELLGMKMDSNSYDNILELLADEQADSAKAELERDSTDQELLRAWIVADSLRVLVRQQGCLVISPKARVGSGRDSFSESAFDCYEAATELDSSGHLPEAQRLARLTLAKAVITTESDLRDGIGLALLLGKPSLGDWGIREVKRFVWPRLGNPRMMEALITSDLTLAEAPTKIAFWRWLADTSRSPTVRANAYVRLAQALIDAERNEEASRVAWRGITFVPSYAFAWWTYGIALYNTDQYARAVGAWERALVLDPKLFDTYGDTKVWEYAISMAGRQPPTPLPARPQSSIPRH